MASFRATAQELLEFELVRNLLFGVYAWPESDEEPHRVQQAGSGILIAREHGLTARHVMHDFFKLDSQFEARRRGTRGIFARTGRELVESSIRAAVYQENNGKQPVQWRVRISSDSEDTDISVLILLPTTPMAEKRALKTSGYLEWQLLPPPVGAAVRVYGWPEPKIDIKGSVHDGKTQLWMRPAVVTEQFTFMRAHGFQDFPGYLLDRKLPHAMSGAAVLHEGRLSGVFTGPDVVSTLWPLALTTYPVRPELRWSFADHFDHQTIRAVDWDRVKGRVERRDCEQGDCLRKHVTLAM